MGSRATVRQGGGPVVVVGIVVLAAIAGVVSVARPELASLAAGVLTVLSAVVVQRFSVGSTHEASLWCWVRRALWLFAAGAVVTAVLDLAGEAGWRPDAARSVFLGIVAVLACALIYQALLGWNRDSSALADPGDRLNGLSATVTLVSLLNLLLLWRNPDLSIGWALQLQIVQVSALLIVLGSTITVATLAALTSDPRPWVMTGGVVGAIVTTTVSILAETPVVGSPVPWSPSWALAGWSLLAAAFAISSVLRSPGNAVQVATPRSAVIGALVVLVAAAAALVLASRFPPERTGTTVLLAAAGIVGVGTRATAIIRDLSSLAQRRVEALTDDLTGLANRRALARRLAEPPTSSEPAALLLLDLDRFKQVNDRFGHEVGDGLLRLVGPVLQETAPATALCVRLGGDEFAVLVTGPEAAQAEPLARRLRRELTAELGLVGTGLDLGAGVRVDVGVSIGVARGGSDRPGDLLRRADAAMYEAKASGAGVAVYDEDVDRRQRERVQLTQDVRDAFEQAELPFEVHYQPQMSLLTGELEGVEALVRWRHPERGLVPPMEFLDTVEKIGRMPALTCFVLRTASHDLDRFATNGVRPRMAVNLSTACLGDVELVERLVEQLAPGVTPGEIVLEVTETTLMTDPVAALSVCTSLSDAGFELSIDDYGTGYSSLSYLSDLPADEVKIDRSFSMRVLADPRVAVIVGATVDLVHRLGLRVVAEGAEDSATMDLLRDLGCDEVQGYALTRPLPAPTLVSWLQERAPARTATPADVDA